MDPINISDPSLWDTFNKIFGPGGIPLLLVIGGLGWAVKSLMQRQKEKDSECQQEMDRQETRSETRFQQMRGDIKEAFGIVGILSEKVTVLVERTTNTRTRNE